ncbi:hypothetical protein ACP70R_019132 [Stipagrostis hirtigluma subsp. patula]
MARSTERAVLGCFPVARRPTSPSPSTTYEEGSTSAASTSLGTVSPLSSASTSSPAFLDDDVLYPEEGEPQADVGGLSTAIASRRFFLASPGRSNSIVDSAAAHGRPRVLQRAATTACAGTAAAAAAAATPSSSSSSGAAAAAAGAPLFPNARDDMQPVRKVSVSTDAPRADFLKSMLEMAEALGLDPRRDADLARLHDLLLCYIALNEREALRDILGAFTDLMCLLDGNAPAPSTAAAADPTADGGIAKTRHAGATDRAGR